ncbi:histidine kinase dimerization/phosphoacceptor domain -containing protein [Paracoccus sp. (in: a-proteobacteria)]|uniref:histidine kinase dimerization/phosphoacceptor domain -containing protein n=1 Tax=Paracoccus sp. TaxID=267 RepID=UPI00396C3F62
MTQTDLPDLSACDKEPIHIPGSIQSFGHMLIVDRASATVVGAAGERDSWSRECLEQPLAHVLGGAFSDLDPGAVKTLPQVLPAVRHDGLACDAVAYRSGEHVVIEMSPCLQNAVLNAGFLSQLEQFGMTMERASNLTDLYRRAAQLFRDLTGFDRVMIYRFLEDEAGVVVGEARSEQVSGFMNHHFPATDIPRQARALYVRNRVRSIADVEASVLPITGTRPGIEGIDLSDSMLRSVSPVHLHYLRNMGVGASASMSIVKDGALWGLVACHNATPRIMGLTTRLACQSMADSLSRQIKLREETELYRERIRLRAHEDMVLSRLGPDDTLAQFFEQAAGDLQGLVSADGFAAVQGQDLFVHGSCPETEDLRALADHICPLSSIRPFVSTCLSKDYPAGEAFQDRASGLLSVTMSTEVPTILMWFRAEKLQLVTWAGNPHKNQPATPGATLEPRASFEAWSQEVRGCARNWTAAETESVSRLVRMMLVARNNTRIRQLNAELRTTLKENESLIRQKEFLLREVNHRVQNSLALVASFLRMQGRLASPEVRVQLEEAQNRLTAVSLVHRRLYQDDSSEIVDLSIYLDDLMKELKASLDGDWGALIHTDFAPILISTDHAVSLGLLLNELIANAAKYAYGGRPGPISVSLRQTRDQLRLEVSDQGIGQDGTTKGTGFGMRMVQALVDRLEGTVTVENNHPGLCVIITAPAG